MPMKRMLTTPEFASYPDDWHFSPVLDCGDFVFLSGVTGTRADLSVAEDPETQFRDAFSFLDAYLAVTGLTFDDVVEMTTCSRRSASASRPFHQGKGRIRPGPLSRLDRHRRDRADHGKNGNYEAPPPRRQGGEGRQRGPSRYARCRRRIAQQRLAS